MRTFPAKYSSLDLIRTFIEQAAQKANLTDKSVYAVQMAVDEACANIIDHAYGGEMADKEIKITCEIKKDNLVITLRDQGRSFNMDSLSSPDLSSPLSERQVGGLGVHLIRSLMDGIKYKSTREAGNTLTLIKKRDNLDVHPVDWLKLNNLSGQLLDTKSLASQRERIQEWLYAHIGH